MTRTPFPKRSAPGSGVTFFVALALTGTIAPCATLAADGATEALELRVYAEQAIIRERTTGPAGMAEAMQRMLPGLLLEYLASRDETIALDVVDAAAVRHDLTTAKLMQDPGLAWALDVFAGPGTGHEHELRSALAHLADFHAAQAEQGLARAAEAAVDVYERQVQRDLARADKLQEMHIALEQRKAEVALAKVTDRAERIERIADKKAEQAITKIEQVAEKVTEQAEKAAEKVEKAAEKSEEKVEKAAEKAAEKAEEKVEEPPAIDPEKEPGKDKEEKGPKK
jgi:hypothetical protein